MITALVFILLNLIGWLLAIVKGPFWALLVYVNIYFNSPLPHINWWALYLPSLRWSLISFAVLAISMFLHRDKLSNHSGNTIKWTYIFFLFTFFITYTNSINLEIAKWHTYMLFTFCLTIFALIKTLSSVNYFKYFVVTLILFAMNLSIKAVFEGKRIHARLENVGTVDTFGSNEFGLLLVGILPLVLPFVFKGNRAEKILGILSIPLIVNAIVLTNSRSAFVALAVAIVYSFVFIADSRLRKYTIWASFFLVPVFLYLADQYFIERMASLIFSDTASDSALNSVSSGRWSVWMHGLDMVRDHPLGVGPGGFRELARHYMPVEQLIFKPGAPYGVKAAHNSYLLVLVEQGYIGLTIYLFICFATIYNLWKSMRLLRENGEMTSFLGFMIFGMNISFMSIVIGGLFNSRVYYEFFWWQIALAVVGHSFVLQKLSDQSVSEE